MSSRCWRFGILDASDLPQLNWLGIISATLRDDCNKAHTKSWEGKGWEWKLFGYNIVPQCSILLRKLTSYLYFAKPCSYSCANTHTLDSCHTLFLVFLLVGIKHGIKHGIKYLKRILSNNIIECKSIQMMQYLWLIWIGMTIYISVITIVLCVYFASTFKKYLHNYEAWHQIFKTYPIHTSYTHTFIHCTLMNYNLIKRVWIEQLYNYVLPSHVNESIHDSMPSLLLQLFFVN